MRKTKPKPKNPAAVTLGLRRAMSLSPEERSAIASKASRARWSKTKRRTRRAA